MNIVNTSKGSAFFVDLDKVIKEEIKKEKKISQEKQSNGTSLFIPLYDEKPKKRPHLGKKNESINRTFTKEDFEKNTPLDKVEIFLKQSSHPEPLKQTKNIQSVLEHNEIISPLLQAYASTALKSRCSDIIKSPDDHNVEKQKLEHSEAVLPKLPKWATGKNLSLDSTILNLHPFLEPKTDDIKIEGTSANTMEIPGHEGDLKIQELFPSEKQHAKKYITAVLPSISRSCSAKSSSNKMSPGFKRKKVTQVKKLSTASSKDLTPTKTKTNKTNRKVQKKKGRGKKGNKRNDAKADNIPHEHSETDITESSSQLQSSSQTDRGYLLRKLSSSSQENVHNGPIKETFDEEIMIGKDNGYDSILDFFEDKHSTNLITGNKLETTMKAEETPRQEIVELHNPIVDTRDEKGSLKYFISCQPTLEESLEKSLSIDSVIDETAVCSPRKKLQVFPHNNYLSKISEEQSRSLYSTKSKLSIINNVHNDSSVKLIENRGNTKSKSRTFDDNMFQEMSQLMFQPGIIREITPSLQSGSIDEYLDDSSLSQGRPYLRSVLGNMSCRSIYSSASSHASSVSDMEVIEWQKGKVIDRGAFGIVYQGLTIKAQLIAVKEVQIGNLKNANKNYKKLEDEINILKALSHRNIIKFIGTSLEENVVYIFMEYIAGGSLAGLISSFGPLKESIFQLYTRQIMSAVFYLHSEGVVHRDIKGANILITVKGIIKLIDFGCAKELSLSLGSTVLLKSVKGTPYWMAPEVIQGTGCNHKSDIWSVGCTVMEMATGKPPWSEYTPYAAMYAIAENSNEPPCLSEKYSDHARTFLNCCLTRDMTIRPSAEELLTHPFICV